MYFRYDTYHDSVQKNKSVGALVASVNGTFTKFVSTAVFHSSPTEMTDRMLLKLGISLSFDKKYFSIIQRFQRQRSMIYYLQVDDDLLTFSYFQFLYV